MRDCPQRQQNNKGLYNIQEATTVNDVARSMPQIYVALDNRHVYHQDSVVEMEGMISHHPISILIDPGSNMSYFTRKNIKKCKLHPIKHAKSRLVQLATRTKKKVT